MKRIMATIPTVVALIGFLTTAGFGDSSRTLGIGTSRKQVGQYEKLDLEIHVDGRYENPFDPNVVDVMVLLKTPGEEQITLPAFYCQDYERRKLDQGRNRVNWYYPVGEGTWKARFAPMQTGTYFVTARLKDKAGIIQSESIRFDCIRSSSKGFLRTCRDDRRFLEFTDSSPFFAIGQNLAFIGESQYVNLTKAEEIFNKLSANGANFVRIWTCCEDWAMAIEARKSAWDRSWNRSTPIETLDQSGPVPRKYVKINNNNRASITVSPSHPAALRPKTRYVLTGRFIADGPTALRVNVGRNNWQEHAEQNEWKEFRREFMTDENEFWLGRISLGLVGSGMIWLDTLSLKEVPDSPELLWEADVNRPIRGFYNQLDCFILDEIIEAAEENGIYLMLCLLTRDLYMKDLSDEKSSRYDEAIRDAKKFMRYAVARWGYSTHVAAWEYFNEMNPDLPTDRFYTAVGEYLEKIDIYHHLRTTSTWHPSAEDCRHCSLDIGQLHHYMRPETKEEFEDEVAVLLDKARFLRTHAPDKPVLIGEFGLATPKWGFSEHMKQDTEGVHFHNSLWASAFSGVSGTAMFWWWDQLDRQNAYDHYRPLSVFFADVSLIGMHLIQTASPDRQFRWLGYKGNDRAYLWIANSQATWWNQVFNNKKPAIIEKATVTIQKLLPGDYQLEWWDTHKGEIIRAERIFCAKDSVQISVPSFNTDIACKILEVKDR